VEDGESYAAPGGEVNRGGHVQKFASRRAWVTIPGGDFKKGEARKLFKR
jgi:hypothetical protein